MLVTQKPAYAAFRRSAMDWAIGHFLLCAIFLGGQICANTFAILLSGLGMALWSPVMGLIGFRATRSAWNGYDEREPHFAVLGMAMMLFLAFLGYVASHGPHYQLY